MSANELNRISNELKFGACFCIILKNYLCKNPLSRNIIFILVFILSQQVNYQCRKRKKLLKIILTFMPNLSLSFFYIK